MAGRRKNAPAVIFTSDDAAKAGLRTAKMLSCGAVGGYWKLRRFSPDLGNIDVRNVFS